VSGFPVTMGVTADGASPKGTVIHKPARYGQCDGGDGRDDELQRLSLRMVRTLKQSVLGNHSYGGCAAFGLTVWSTNKATRRTSTLRNVIWS
jgi:hypothetical protein